MSFDTFIVTIAVIANVVIALFAYTRNPKSTTHRLFALLTVVIAAWSVTNYISILADSNPTATWLVRFVMFFSVPFGVLFFLLVHTFPRATFLLSRKKLAIILGLMIVTMAIALSPLLFPRVEIVSGQPPQPHPGIGMVLYIPVVIVGILYGIGLLVRKTIKATGIQKTQHQFLLLGVSIMFILIIGLNFVAVNLFNTTAFIPLGPLFTLPFVGLTAYTIARHRMMDIRLAVARSLSFSFLVGTFFVLYGAVLVFGAPWLSDLVNVPIGIIAGIGALLSVVIARYVQDILKRVTDRYLFQNKVNYEAALLKLGKDLASTIKMNEVTTLVLRTMSDIVRARKTIVMLRDEKTRQFSPYVEQGAVNFHVSIPVERTLIRYLKKTNDPLVSDELSIMKEHATSPQLIAELEEIKNDFEWLDVSVIVPLFVNKQLTGLILLGEKLSGEPYLQDDVKFLDAFASQAATALDNAQLYQQSLEFGERLTHEVEQATHDLALANEQLQDLDKAKSEFLSVASHQLYTPLTALRGYLSMIQEGDFGKVSDEQKPVMNILQNSAQRLITLIKNLLDISRIEAGRLELNLESTDLAAMAKVLVQDLMPNAMKKNLKLLFHQPKDPVPRVVVDRERARQVMLNFIDNSIKYTPKGHVDVKVAAQGTEVIFSVSDTGKGLTQVEIQKLFNKFTRVGGSDRLHTEGTGLGLYVAKQIVEEHRGHVAVSSPGLGKGSTFSMRLPAEGNPKSLKIGEHATVEIKASGS